MINPAAGNFITPASLPHTHLAHDTDSNPFFHHSANPSAPPPPYIRTLTAYQPHSLTTLNTHSRTTHNKQRNNELRGYYSEPNSPTFHAHIHSPSSAIRTARILREHRALVEDHQNIQTTAHRQTRNQTHRSDPTPPGFNSLNTHDIATQLRQDTKTYRALAPIILPQQTQQRQTTTHDEPEAFFIAPPQLTEIQLHPRPTPHYHRPIHKQTDCPLHNQSSSTEGRLRITPTNTHQ